MCTHYYLFILLAALVITACGGEEKADIQTNAVCQTCEAILKEGLEQKEGIKDVNLNLDTKVLTVGYDPSQLNQSEIENFIAKIGYDANEIKANIDTHAGLPYCCQIENKVPKEDKVHEETLSKRK